MGNFTNGDDEEDELFDLYMLNKIHESNNKVECSNHSGGCFTGCNR